MDLVKKWRVVSEGVEEAEEVGSELSSPLSFSAEVEEVIEILRIERFVQR